MVGSRNSSKIKCLCYQIHRNIVRKQNKMLNNIENRKQQLLLVGFTQLNNNFMHAQILLIDIL
jgi:hypothetical protein